MPVKYTSLEPVALGIFNSSYLIWEGMHTRLLEVIQCTYEYSKHYHIGWIIPPEEKNILIDYIIMILNF